MSIEETWGAKWSEELDRRGMASVVAMLSSRAVGTGRASTYYFGIQGMPDPTREFVEGWIIRREAATRKLETRRFHYIFWPALLAALASVWFVVRDWFR
jgi:hypothetical protein